ncbi:MAG TPA: hypothetical protein ENK18_28680 [Deltaproteobacteria bacterium]|nr:hypothetical protein [Deltaproteobacteria bacterium]
MTWRFTSTACGGGGGGGGGGFFLHPAPASRAVISTTQVVCTVRRDIGLLLPRPGVLGSRD